MEQVDYGEDAFSGEDDDRHYALRRAAPERVLGPMHGLVGHATYYVGGAVDMSYFPNVTEGTACATLELIEPDGTGPLPSEAGTYELIAS